MTSPKLTNWASFQRYESTPDYKQKTIPDSEIENFVENAPDNNRKTEMFHARTCTVLLTNYFLWMTENLRSFCIDRSLRPWD